MEQKEIIDIIKYINEYEKQNVTQIILEDITLGCNIIMKEIKVNQDNRQIEIKINNTKTKQEIYIPLILIEPNTVEYITRIMNNKIKTVEQFILVELNQQMIVCETKRLACKTIIQERKNNTKLTYKIIKTKEQQYTELDIVTTPIT